MNILEQEIEDLVWNAMQEMPDELEERGFPYDARFTYVRQPNLFGYGQADIIGFRVHEGCSTVCNRTIDVSIIELKKEQVNTGTFLQALRYAKGIEHLFENDGINATLRFELHLVGKSIDESGDFCYLPDIVDNVNLYTFGVNLVKGVKFTRHHSFTLTRHGFNGPNSFLMPTLKSSLRKNILYNRDIGDLPF